MRIINVLFFGALLLAGPLSADDFFNPPRLEQELPPWLQNNEGEGKKDNSEKGDKKDDTSKGEDKKSGEGDKSAGPPPGFWGSDEDDKEEDASGESDFSFGGSSKSSSGSSNPKDSFKLVESSEADVSKNKTACIGWGHPFLGVTMYQKSKTCNFVLRKKAEESRQDVRSLEDHTRILVQKEVIKGNIKRDASKTFKPKYDLVLDILNEAEATGCKCLN